MNALAAMLSLTLLTAMPPLSDQQKAYVAAVKDNVPAMDEGFYALMENASTWPVTDPPMQGMKLDVNAMLATPGEYRGTPVLIEGKYETLHPVYRVQRSGPWDGKLEQWGIKVGDTDQIVMVYLTAPPPVPVKGTKLKLVARFYKVWPVQAEEGGETKPYLVFVGRSAQVFSGDRLPALTDIQRLQLNSATDFSEDIDVGALYPLLSNVVEWKDQPMPLVPLVTHAEPVIGAPQDYRGDLLRVEGILTARRKLKLQRPGAWPSEIEEWPIRITERDDPRDEYIVAYVVYPPKAFEVGDKVRVVGRFYKVWRSYTSRGEENIPHNYIAIVASTAEPIDKLPASAGGAAAKSEGGGAGAAAAKAGLAVMVLLGFGLLMLRRFLKRAGAGPGRTSMSERIERIREERAKRDERDPAHDNGDGEVTGPPLPEDPTAALEELERRRATEG